MRLLVPLVLPLALFTLARADEAQGRKLNGPLSRGSLGSLFPGSSPDGQVLVYVADHEGDGISEVYSVALDGRQDPRRLQGVDELGSFTRDRKSMLVALDPDGDGRRVLSAVPVSRNLPPIPLSAPFVAGGELGMLLVSPDGVHAVYLADAEVDEVVELFSVPLDGSAPPRRLSGALVAGGDVQSMVLSQDGRQVLYQADQQTDEVSGLFVVPSDGSLAAHELHVPLVMGGAVQFFALDADGTHAIYLADQEEDERFELFSIPTDDSQPPLKLNGPLVAGGDVGQPFSFFHLTPDTRQVLYRADQEADERFELFSVPVDGSRPALKLSRAADQDVSVATLSHDSAWAIYQSDPGGTRTFELFSVPVDGSAPARPLSGPMVVGGDAFFPQVSFDSQLVVYEADQDVDEVHEIYGAPIDGSAPPVKLNAPFQPNGDLAVSRGNLLPGFWVMQAGAMYEADQEQDGLIELYFAPFPLGSAVRKLANGPESVSYPLGSFLESPPTDFGQVVFLRGDALLAVSVEPGAQPVVLDTLAPGAVVGDVLGFELAPAGDRVVYRAREGMDLEADLYSVSTDKPSLRVQLHPEGSRVRTSFSSPDGSRVLFVGALDPSGTFDLYSVPADGTAAPIRLNAPLAEGEFLLTGSGDLTIGPLGELVAFLVHTDGGARLFTAPLDGSRPAWLLSAALPAGRSARGPRFSADESRLVFWSGPELYGVPVDGSLPAVRLSAPAHSVQADYQLAPDGDLVLYRTDSSGTRKGELYAVPSDGSAEPQRLNPTLPAGGDVVAFALAPDASRAFYLADQALNEQYELYGVPTDGSTPAVRLSGGSGADRDVLDFQLAPDGQTVVFRADLQQDERFDLYRVPAEGSLGPARVGRSPSAVGSVLEYGISPDSRRVVYRADAVTPGAVDLFSAPIRGTRGLRRIGQAPLTGGRVRSFRISADSSTVAFAAERDAARQSTLLAVPIAGEEKAVELAGPFQDSGSVLDYALGPGGSVVVYRADQNESGVVELFAATGRRAPHPRSR